MKAITVRFNEDEWEDLNKGLAKLLASVGVKMSKHQFLKSCIRLGLEDFSKRTK